MSSKIKIPRPSQKSIDIEKLENKIEYLERDYDRYVRNCYYLSQIVRLSGHFIPAEDAACEEIGRLMFSIFNKGRRIDNLNTKLEAIINE
jgi:hypothetical protein